MAKVNGLTDNLLYDNIASSTFAFESYGTRDALEGGLVKRMNEGLLPSLVSVTKNVVRRLEVCLDPCDVFFYCARQPKVNIFPKVALQNDMDCSGGAGWGATTHLATIFP